jgi:glucose/arabinose dehydrogenase
VQPGARAADSTGRVTGRILRVDVRGAGPSGERFDVADASNRYNVPVDNPFVGRRDADPLLFVSPLQDPSGMAWDRETGDLWISDGGGERGEQIQRVVVAQRLAESVVDELDTGSQVLAMERPGRSLDTQLESVYVLPRPGGQPESANAAGVSFEGMAVVGGTVYRGDIPNWRGRYLFGDAGAEGRPGRLWSFRHREGEVTELLDHSALLRGDDGTRLDRLASFVEDGRGELYLLDEDGEVFQLAPSAHGVMAWAPGLLGLVGVMLMLRSPRRRDD